MKYRKANGTVFNTLGEAVDDYCKGKSCDACPMDKVVDDGIISCCDWAVLHQTEAAELMGLEIVQEEPAPDSTVNPAQEAETDEDPEEPMETYECQRGKPFASRRAAKYL